MKPKNGSARAEKSVSLSGPRRKNRVQKSLSLVCLLLLLSGCTPLVNQTSVSTVPASPTPVSAPNNFPLKITTADGLNCPPQEFDIMPNALVLATDRLSYTPAEIQQMAMYVDKAYKIFRYKGPEELQSLPRPPSPLKLVPASLTKGIGAWNLSPENRKPGCIAKMTITNISRQPVRFQGIQARLTWAPQENRESYRFLNICSLPSSYIKHERQADPTATICPAYPQEILPDCKYEISLQIAPAGTVFQGKNKDRLSSCLHRSIDPGDSLTLHLNFRAQGGSVKYALSPEVVVEASGKEEIITAEPETTLVYTNPEHVSCYTLPQGEHAFVSLAQQDLGDPPGAYAHNRTWCL